MRVIAACAAVVYWVAACGTPAGPAPPPAEVTASGQPAPVDPTRIHRVRAELPPGYETAEIAGRAVPQAFWGIADDGAADPPQCAALADPVLDETTAHGWSASGAGGIVYAAVARAPTVAPGLVDQCAEWTVTSGNTSGTVALVAAPTVADTPTIGMATTARTVVEGGTEIAMHADTFSAYLGDHVAFVTVVSDPGSPEPQLGPEFASALLVETVSELRG